MTDYINKSWNISAALQFGRNVLKDNSSTPDLDAQLLLCFALKISKLQIIVDSKKEILEPEIVLFLKLIERRKNQEPVAYITGKKEFWGIEFDVSPAVLIPRPDTELLVDMALTFSAEFPDPILACDLGTGSGCIAVSLAFELRRRTRNFFVLAVDKSLAALKIAQRNSKNNGFDEEIRFLCSDWNAALDQEFDLVIANPPYLITADSEVSAELKYEPQSALYAGHDGLDDYRKIFKYLPALLSDRGVFLGEIGYGQAHLVEKLAREMFLQPKIEFHYDLRRVQRVVEIRFEI